MAQEEFDLGNQMDQIGLADGCQLCVVFAKNTARKSVNSKNCMEMLENVWNRELPPMDSWCIECLEHLNDKKTGEPCRYECSETCHVKNPEHWKTVILMTRSGPFLEKCVEKVYRKCFLRQLKMSKTLKRIDTLKCDMTLRKASEADVIEVFQNMKVLVENLKFQWDSFENRQKETPKPKKCHCTKLWSEIQEKVEEKGPEWHEYHKKGIQLKNMAVVHLKRDDSCPLDPNFSLELEKPEASSSKKGKPVEKLENDNELCLCNFKLIDKPLEWYMGILERWITEDEVPLDTFCSQCYAKFKTIRSWGNETETEEFFPLILKYRTMARYPTLKMESILEQTPAFYDCALRKMRLINTMREINKWLYKQTVWHENFEENHYKIITLFINLKSQVTLLQYGAENEEKPRGTVCDCTMRWENNEFLLEMHPRSTQSFDRQKYLELKERMMEIAGFALEEIIEGCPMEAGHNIVFEEDSKEKSMENEGFTVEEVIGEEES